MLAKSPVCCCLDTPDPGPWQAGVDDGADREMIMRMHAVRSMLHNGISNEDLVKALRISSGLDQRTRLGYHIQCCVLHLAASRLELLALGRNPAPYPKSWWYRLTQAWEVFRDRASAVGHSKNSPMCMARKQALPEPGECDWPQCGCDPHAEKVIAALVEQGWQATC